MPGWRAEDASALWKAGLGQIAVLRVCRAKILSSAKCWSAAVLQVGSEKCRRSCSFSAQAALPVLMVCSLGLQSWC